MPINGTIVETYARLIRDVGFPVVVSGVLIWFMIARLSPAIDKLSDVINKTMGEFSQVINKQTQAFERSVEVNEENNERLRQLMGDAPWRRERRETTR